MAFTRTPKYQQIADALRAEITSGALPPAAPLPSEAQIQARFGVSRAPAVQAIAVLRAEGLVTTLHGRGSFVRRATDRPSHTHERAITTPTEADTAEAADGTRFTDRDLDATHWRPVEDPAHYRADATTELALVLHIPEHAPLFVGDRLLADSSGRRMSHRLYLPVETCIDVPALTDDPYRDPGELYTILAAAGHRLAWVEQVRAKMPTPDDQAALTIPDGTPMLVTRRLTVARITDPTDPTGHTETGRPLAMEETRLSAEDAQLAYAITPYPATT